MRLSSALFALVLLLTPSPGMAQTTGSINGIVSDNTGAVLPGVTVTATSPVLMGAQSTVTNETGNYQRFLRPTSILARGYFALASRWASSLQ